MKYERIPYIRYVPIIVISFFLFRIVNNIENVGGLIEKFFSLLSFFVWGFCIAYLLNPLMMYIERKTKVNRNGALLIVYTFFIGLIVLSCIGLVPILVRNILDLINNMPDYINKIQKWILEFVNTNQYMHRADVSSYMENNLSSIMKNANTYIGTGLSILFKNLINLSNLLLKVSTGIVISIYFLKDKEHLLKNIKKFMRVTIGEENAEKTAEFGNSVNNIFKRFVIGKIIDSIVVGIICFLALVMLNIPFALIISIIVGVTNLIPYFGGFIGMGPAFLITLFASPIKAIEVVVLLLVLGEVDGLFIGPKIVGGKIGLNPLWIILGITLGGGFYGVVGMFLGVPAMAVIKALLQEFMQRRLKDEKPAIKRV
jgi:predicted PurR-regulated permease PerM